MAAGSTIDEFHLHTSRLVLRDFRHADLPAVHALRSDPNVARFMDFFAETPEQSRTWLAGAIHHNGLRPRSAYNLAITERDKDRTIGWIGFGDSERHPGEGNVGVGYMLASSHWRRGYASEALRQAIAFVFGTLEGRYISAWCAVDNTASARVMQKAGLQFARRF